MSHTRLGVRKAIAQAFNCAYFKPNLNVFEVSEHKHDVIINKLKQRLEKEYKGIKCIDCNNEKNKGSSPCMVENEGVRGIMDLLCLHQDKVLVFEIKSTEISNMKIHDLLQLALYVYLYSNSYKVALDSIRAFLVYSYRSHEEADVYIIELVNELKKSVVNFVKSFVSHREQLKDRNEGFYVVSSLCDICVNNACPFKANMG
jgi:CRISPR/Cas system-associated exonuclease Cas4 (RecB family)